MGDAADMHLDSMFYEDESGLYDFNGIRGSFLERGKAEADEDAIDDFFDEPMPQERCHWESPFGSRCQLKLGHKGDCLG